MKNLAYKMKHARLRKTPVLVALIAALVVPGVIRAYAEDNPAPAADEALVVANINEEGELETEEPGTQAPAEEAPVPEPTDDELPATEEEQVVEDVTEEEIINDETTEDPVEEADTPQAVLDRYLQFAAAEHPGVEVAAVKFVWKNGVKSAKITFADGWKVYIGVSDGSTLSVADARNKVHRCQRRMKQWKPHFNWHRQFKSYYQWWQNQQNHQDEAEEHDEGAEVQAQRTQSTRKSENRNKKHSDKRKGAQSQSESRGRHDRR